MVPKPEDIVWQMRNFVSRRSLAANRIFDLAAPPSGIDPDAILKNLERTIPMLQHELQSEAQSLLEDLKNLVTSLRP